MSVATLVPIEEYLSTVYEPDCDYVDGELIERNMGEPDHAGMQMGLAAMLYQRRREFGIRVYTELRIQVGPSRFRVPDIAVTTRKGKGRTLREPPFLCVEILSPDDRMSRVEARIDDVIAFGVPFVWLVDPRRRKAWIYTQTGRVETTDALTASNPDLRLSLAEVFAALDEAVDPE